MALSYMLLNMHIKHVAISAEIPKYIYIYMNFNVLKLYFLENLQIDKKNLYTGRQQNHWMN